jgi:O-antigen ligase
MSYAPQIRVVPMVAVVAAAAGALAALSSHVAVFVPIAIVVVFGAGVALVKRPQLGLPIALVLLWSDSTGVAHFYHGAPSSAGGIVALLLLFPLVAGRLRGDRIRLDEGFMWMVAFVLALVISTLASSYESVGLGRIEKTVQEGLVIYLLLINVVRTPEALRASSWALIGAGGVLALFSAAQVLGHRYAHSFFGFAQIDHSFLQQKDSTYRVSGPVADANYYAQLLIPPLALAIVAMFREPTRRARTWAATAAALMLLAVVLTYSRGGAFAIAVVLLMLVCLRYVRLRHLVVALCVIAGLLIAFPTYGSRLGTLANVGGATASVGSSNAADLSVQQRTTENLAAWLAITDHPLLGLGPGGFPIAYQEYASKVGGAIHTASTHADAVPAGQAPQRAVPNILLSIAADDGALGLLVFLCLVGSVAMGLVRARRRWVRRDPQLEAIATGYLLAIVGYVVAGAFLALAFERYLWALLALGTAATWVLLHEGEADVARGVPVTAAPQRLPVTVSTDAVGRRFPRGADESGHAVTAASDTLVAVRKP